MTNKTIARRTVEEIAAKFPHALKLKGVLFEDWVTDQKNSVTNKNSKQKRPAVAEMVVSEHNILRRTTKEIEAGLPLGMKRDGMTLEAWLERQEKKEKKPIPEKEKTKEVKSEFFSKPKQPDPPPKKVYVRSIERIIIQTKDNEEEIKNLINEAVDQCLWEWKNVPLDNKFKITILDKLGKDGWKFAFIYEPGLIDSKSNKPDLICFQRPKK